MKNNLTLIILLVIILLAASIADPYFNARILGTIQSIVTITLGITAIMYLWRRM